MDIKEAKKILSENKDITDEMIKQYVKSTERVGGRLTAKDLTSKINFNERKEEYIVLRRHRHRIFGLRRTGGHRRRFYQDLQERGRVHPGGPGDGRLRTALQDLHACPLQQDEGPDPPRRYLDAQPDGALLPDGRGLSGWRLFACRTGSHVPATEFPGAQAHRGYGNPPRQPNHELCFQPW